MKGAVVEERFNYKGFPCVVAMQILGFRTGYVGLSKDNPLYGVYRNDIFIDFECNGGLTYSGNHLIGQDDKDIWWIGFDAGHCWNGYDVNSLKILFSDDKEAMERIKRNEEIGYFSYPSERPMYLEDIKNDCMRIVDQLLDVKE